MNVSLTPELAERIRSTVATGRYNNASEVVRAALRLLEEYDRDDAFRAAVAEGHEEAERGELIPYTPDLFEEVKARTREDKRKGHPVNPLVLPELRLAFTRKARQDLQDIVRHSPAIWHHFNPIQNCVISP